MNIAIVTGASSGMGRESVYFIDRKYRKLDEIWVIARRKDSLIELQKECKLPVRVFDFDLCDKEKWTEFNLELKTFKPNVRLLVNCAGFGFLSDFHKADINTWEKMLDLNCKALMRMSHTIIPYMHKGARMIQFASSAAFVPQPGFNVYAATKAFVLSFSRALNAELQKKGITVTAVCPGPVQTEFFDIADPNNKTKFFKKLLMADPRAVVAKAFLDAKLQKDVSVYGIVMNLFWGISKFLPHRIFIELMKW